VKKKLGILGFSFASFLAEISFGDATRKGHGCTSSSTLTPFLSRTFVLDLLLAGNKEQLSKSFLQGWLDCRIGTRIRLQRLVALAGIKSPVDQHSESRRHSEKKSH